MTTTHASTPKFVSPTAPSRAPTLRRAIHATAGGMTTLIAAACLLAANDARAESLRGFWAAPSFDALATHTMLLRERRAADASDPAVVADDEAALERMKVWLAKGIVGSTPDQPVTWDSLQAAAHRIVTARDVRAETLQPAVFGLHGALGLFVGTDSWPLEHDDGRDNDVATRLAAVVRSVDLPAVGESWFDDALQITLDDKPAEELSGRFGIVHTAKTLPAPTAAPDTERYRVALTQPLMRSTIHVDGRIDNTPTHASAQRVLWGEDGADPCQGFVPGFRYGDADARYWSALGLDAYTRSQEAGMKPVGSIASIITRDGLPLASAAVQTTHHVLDPQTGFAYAMQTRFDLDDDGITDLLVWEGRGDDTQAAADALPQRHRLFFVNVLGQWHLLGHDAPVASCHGC